MVRNALLRLALPVMAIATLTIATGPALAQHGGGHGGGGHGGGGFGGGGFHAGGVHAGGFHPGGYHGGGFHSGMYHAGYGGYGYHPYYHGGYYGLGYYPYAGYGVYPSYGSAYFPSDYTGAYYYDGGSYPYYSTFPALGSDAITTPPVSSTQMLDPSGLSPSPPTVPVEPANGTAHLTVRLPDQAELWFNGTQVTGTGPVREFSTPPLTPGHKYSYEVRARWTDQGRTTERTQTVTFAPGDSASVLFPAGTAATPSGAATSR